MQRGYTNPLVHSRARGSKDMPSNEARKPQGSTAQSKSAQAAHVPSLRAADLFGDARELILEHNGQMYRLRITANDKLILTK
jgi:hemin uptake protein HemP